MFKVTTVWEILPPPLFASPVLTQKNLKQNDKNQTNWCSYIKRENVKCKKTNVRPLHITGTNFLTGKQERRGPKAGRL